LLDLLKIIVAPTLLIYWVIIKTRNKFFDKKIFSEEKINAKVISIGNLTVGGSGKTPAVIYITKLLKNAGKKVGILSRGYGRSSKGYHLVSKGDEILIPVDKSGDEIFLAANECKVPAAVSERRVAGAKNFVNDVDVECIVLDDAYQHRWINRDWNVLMFDQRFLLKKGEIDQNLLPLGRMRETFSSVDRADAIVINRKFSEKKDLPAKIIRLFEGKNIFFSYYKVTGIFDVKNHRFYKLEEFKGQKSLVVCGIARPYSFLKVLESNEIDISNKVLFTDHKDYDLKEVNLIRKKFYDTNTQSVITTQKDAVKLTNYAKELDDIDIYYLKIELKLEEDEKFRNQILNVFNK